LLKGREEKLRYVPGIGVNLCVTMPMLGERVGGSFVTWPLLAYLFLDWEMWARGWGYINRLTCPVYCPFDFPEENKTPGPVIPPHFNRFKRYYPGKLLERGIEGNFPLSNNWHYGLRFSRSSVVPAINIAYLQGAAEIALLGVDLNDYSHFNSEEFKGTPYPEAETILKDLWEIAKFLKSDGVRCWNCSPDSAVRGWEKVSLRKMFKQARRQFLERLGNPIVRV